MEWVRKAREHRGLSQRNLASRAGVSFRTLQLLESGRWDPKLSTLKRVVTALGYPENAVEGHFERLAKRDVDSVAVWTERLAGCPEDEDSWKIHFFNFVDRFRSRPEKGLIDEPPSSAASNRIRALAASAVEALCHAQGWIPPDWCRGVPPIKAPWFPSGIENLKASALVESPADFRKRNIFVLENFLERA